MTKYTLDSVDLSKWVSNTYKGQEIFEELVQCKYTEARKKFCQRRLSQCLDNDRYLASVTPNFGIGQERHHNLIIRKICEEYSKEISLPVC